MCDAGIFWQSRLLYQLPKQLPSNQNNTPANPQTVDLRPLEVTP